MAEAFPARGRARSRPGEVHGRRCGNRLKNFRGIATRYDKLVRNVLSAILLAAATILLS